MLLRLEGRRLVWLRARRRRMLARGRVILVTLLGWLLVLLLWRLADRLRTLRRRLRMRQ